MVWLLQELSLLIALLNVALAASSSIACNGHLEYCDKRYSELVYTGAHDSPFVRTTAFTSIFGNQFYYVTTQLNSGIRMLQAQSHSPSGNSTAASGIELCHTSCALTGADFGSVETYD